MRTKMVNGREYYLTFPKGGGEVWVPVDEPIDVMEDLRKFEPDFKEETSQKGVPKKKIIKKSERHGWLIPEDLHLLYKEKWTELYGERGCVKLLRDLSQYL